MPSQYQDEINIHFDATCGTLSGDGFEIPGVQKFDLDPGTQEKGSVVIVGSDIETGVTLGAVTPGKGMMTVYLGSLFQWLAGLNLDVSTYRNHLFTFIGQWSMLDEELNTMPPVTAEFSGFLEIPSKWATDRTQASQAIVINVPIRVVGRVSVTVNGVTIQL